MANPLATLQRLRRMASDQARRDLAAALEAERAAESRVQAALAAMRDEALNAATDAAHPLAGAYGRWLPAAQAKRAALSEAVAIAQRGVEAARGALAQARAAARAVEIMEAERAAEGRRDRLRKEQAAADDLAGGRK